LNNRHTFSLGSFLKWDAKIGLKWVINKLWKIRQELHQQRVLIDMTDQIMQEIHLFPGSCLFRETYAWNTYTPLPVSKFLLLFTSL